MDNIFISEKFLRAVHAEKKSKTMVQRVLQKKVCGLTNFVLQEDYTEYRKKYYKMRGKTKAAVLDGGSECPDVVTLSVYDTKPINFFVYGGWEVGVEHQRKGDLWQGK